MSQSLAKQLGLKTQPVARTEVRGVIRTLDDVAALDHPYPILYQPLYFVCVCLDCGVVEVGPRRSDLTGALYDRMVHSRDIHKETVF